MQIGDLAGNRTAGVMSVRIHCTTVICYVQQTHIKLIFVIGVVILMVWV